MRFATFIQKFAQNIFFETKAHLELILIVKRISSVVKRLQHFSTSNLLVKNVLNVKGWRRFVNHL